MTLIDTNIILDIVQNDPVWADWSQSRVEAASLAGPLVINDIVYAELSMGYDRIEALDAFIEESGLKIVPMPKAALFLAGKSFVRYRREGGLKTGVLPNFFIGAHAAVERQPLLTRDVRRYRTYFPSVVLIAPPIR